VYKFSGYPQANISFAEYIRANYCNQFTTVNNCIVFSSLAIFQQVAKEEELKPEPVTKVAQFKKIAFIFSDGEAVTA